VIYWSAFQKNWVSHATPSGYMDRDGWYKTIDNFSKLSGASLGNPQFLFFDGHDSHWDADSLDLMKARHIEAFFLKPVTPRTIS
jgi:hypothetical protein